MPLTIPGKLTPQQYLAIEREAELKSEFWDGEMFAMSGSRANHNIISARIIYLALQRLSGKQRTVFPSDRKVGITKARGFAYPDVSIVCGEPKYYDAVTDVLTNPTAIFEVLSDSTPDFDLGGKSRAYRKLASLRHYVTVEQTCRSVEHIERTSEDSWSIPTLTSSDAVLKLSALGIEIPPSEIYEDIQFPPPDPDDEA